VVPKLVALIDRVSWEVQTHGSDAVFIPVWADGHAPHEPVEMLEEFFRTDAASIDAVENFLRKYGDFYPPSRRVTLREFASWQGRLQHMRLNLPANWKPVRPVTPLNLAFQMEWKGNQPQWRLEAMGCLPAMAAVIHLDHARGVRFGVCRSFVCRKIFERTTGHMKQYCGRTCQHREVVRSASLAAKKAKTAARRVKTAA
jgi:hypothetical protein